MAARPVVLVVCAIPFLIPSAWAADADESVPAGDVVQATLAPGDPGLRSRLAPRINSEMSAKNRGQLVAGFEIAVERVRQLPECQELFTRLGADGIATLAGVSFYPIGRREARADLCRGSVAYTLVGGGPTWVCREFWRLTDNQAATIVIHEGLHHAGLGEWPRDPDGLRSAAINRMVEKRCGL